MNSTANRLAATTTSTTLCNNKSRLPKSSTTRSKSTVINSNNNNNKRSIVGKRQIYVSVTDSKNQQVYKTHDNNEKLKKSNCITQKVKYDIKKPPTRKHLAENAATEEEDVVLRVSNLKKAETKNNNNNCMTRTEEEGAFEELRQHHFCQNSKLNLSRIVQFNSQKELLITKSNGRCYFNLSKINKFNFLKYI